MAEAGINEAKADEQQQVMIGVPPKLKPVMATQADKCRQTRINRAKPLTLKQPAHQNKKHIFLCENN
jgi:hypothetical protein